MTNTNLCAHFKCPHYSAKDYCKRYFVTGHCPVNGIVGVSAASTDFLSIDLDKTNPNSRNLIRHGIAMTSMEVGGGDA